MKLTNTRFLLSILLLGSFSITHAETEYKGIAFDDGSIKGSYIYSLDASIEDAIDFDAFSSRGSLSYSEFNLTREYQTTSLHFANAFAQNEQYNQFGISAGKSRLDLFAGYGEDTTSLRSQLDSIDPYLFHGGNNREFQYKGFSVNQQVSKGLQLNYVQSVISADNLDDRQVQVMSFAGNRLNFSYATVELDDSKVGAAYSLGAQFAGQRIDITYLQQNNGAQYTAINFSRLHKGITYKVQLQKSDNPLFSLKSESRIMFSMGFDFGKGYKPLYATQSEGEQSGPNKVLIGSLAVGAGLALSSGSSSSDSLARFGSQDAAARDVLNRINPVSVSLNREHGGYVFRNSDGSFSSTSPRLGEVDSIYIPPIAEIVPSNARATATYHTHGGPDPRYDSENFSPADLEANRALNLVGYLGTPGGLFKRHDPITDAQVVLGTIAN